VQISAEAWRGHRGKESGEVDSEAATTHFFVAAVKMSETVVSVRMSARTVARTLAVERRPTTWTQRHWGVRIVYWGAT